VNLLAILFVNAPNQIFYCVLPLIEEKKFDKLTIVTTRELAPFFKKQTDAEVLVPDVHPNLITYNTKQKIISNSIKGNLEYRRLFKNIKNEDVYVFFTSWSVVFFSFIKKLSKKNKIYFYLREGNYNPNFDNSSSLFKKEKNLRALLMRFAAKLLLNVDVFILNKSGAPVWELKRGTFPMQVVKYEPDLKLIKKYISKDQLPDDKEILFLGQDLSYICDDEESIINLTDFLMNIFDKNFNDLYMIKSHPRDTKLYGNMAKSKHILPPDIMAETLMGHNWKYVIGYYSGSLISAKMHTNAKVISLLNLWKWNDLKLKQNWSNEFENRGIILPKTIDELKQILSNNKK